MLCYHRRQQRLVPKHVNKQRSQTKNRSDASLMEKPTKANSKEVGMDNSAARYRKKHSRRQDRVRAAVPGRKPREVMLPL